MKFSCEKASLLEAINTSQRAVSGKSTIALLEGLLLQTKNDSLTLTGYDLSLGIQTSIDADITQAGQIVLNAKLLGDIVRKLPDHQVYLETDEKLMTTIKCGRSVFNLIASPADDYPELPQVNCEKSIVLPENILKSMISRTIFAVSDNESRPINTGCLFETQEDQLNVVAVDGFRLSVRREKLEKTIEEPLKFVVPGFALREIERVLSEEDAPCTIYPDEKHILFSIGSTMLITRLIDGEFLNYRASIPQDNTFQITVNVRELITCIERVSLIVSEKLKSPVRMIFEEDMLKMSCITGIGKSYDECQIEGQIDHLEIGFNNRYMLDALRACMDEKVTILLKGALNPMILTPLEGDKFTHLVLPVRLKADT